MGFCNSSLCLVLGSPAVAPAHAAIEVDLLTTKADLSILGGTIADLIVGSQHDGNFVGTVWALA